MDAEHSSPESITLQSGNGRIELASDTGYPVWIGLAEPAACFLRGHAGFFDLALPLPQCVPHRLRLDSDQLQPDVIVEEDRATIRYRCLRSGSGEFPIMAELGISPGPDATFSLQLEIVNRTPYTVPQVIFPDLCGLIPTGLAGEEILRFGRNRKQLRPYADMTITDGAASFIDLYRKQYYEYGGFDFCMKWFDLGGLQQGLSLYSRDLTADVQGLYVEKAAAEDSLQLGWAHYPHVAPGETWHSPEFILYPHAGNWQEGARPYREFVSCSLPPAPKSKYLAGALGFRTIWCANSYDNRPICRFKELPAVAKDALDHGCHEISLWVWTDRYMELPYRLHPALGTEEELREAISACREMGVNLVPFTSVRGIRPETQPDEWFEHDRLGHRRYQSWSYHPDFIPPFNPPFYDSFVSAMVCPASRGWGEAYLQGAGQLAKWGFSSVGFDQIYVNAPCYNEAHDHKPQETAAGFHRVLREGIEIGRQVDPDGTFSGEFFGDIAQTFQQYTWDWFTQDPEVAAPYRFVFPGYRIGFLVDRSLRWLLEGFTHGFYLNFYPNGGTGQIADVAQFSDTVKQLASLRRTFSRFFEDGQYFGSTPVQGKFGAAALYRSRDEFLLILANPHAEPAPVDLAVDFRPEIDSPQLFDVAEFGIDGAAQSRYQAELPALTLQSNLAAHDLRMFHFVPCQRGSSQR